jgi:hypothetical protein
MVPTGDIPAPEAASLEAIFLQLRRLLPAPHEAGLATLSPEVLANAFTSLAEPLADARRTGGLTNPWAVAGLRRDEVRVACALAGLWRREFGGAASTRFLAAYLEHVVPGTDWVGELAYGYSIIAELCPLGDVKDRVDLVIESNRRIVGIEVKIGAGLGERQLERYQDAIKQRADMGGRDATVLLLAPFRPQNAPVHCSTWHDVAEAAAQTLRSCDRSDFVPQLIAKFGEYVRTFQEK